MALVEIEQLTYAYPDSGDTPQLRECSLSIGHGELVLVVGPSGCGKSTLLRAVNGLVPHFQGGTMSGRVRVGGLDTREHAPYELAHLVACVFQDPEAQMVSATVFEEVVVGLENLGVPATQISFRAYEALGAMGITHLAARSIATLSGGEMQRVAIAAALAMRPLVLVLDEPTSQLDPSAAEILLELLRRVNEDSGIAVLLAEHRLERCYHWADRVVVMAEGRIVCDAPPRDCAAWGMAHGTALVPPVTRLFDGMDVERLPLTVKEGRAELRRMLARGARDGGGAAAAAMPRPDAGERLAASVSRPAADPPALLVRDLRFSYPDGFEALRGCSLRIEQGDFIAIMGENGAGKSTLIRHFNGLNRVQSGRVSLLGRDLHDLTAEEAARTCAVLGQNPNDYLFCDTVAQELDFSLAHVRPEYDAGERRAAAEAVLDVLGLTDLMDAEPRSLSAGQRQRVAIAVMMVGKPQVLVLDEPTRGLDWESKAALGARLREIQQSGTTVVMVTHDVEFAAAFAQHVAVLGAGRVVGTGTTAEVLGSSMLLAPQVTRVLAGELGDGVVTMDAARQLIFEAVQR